MIALLEADGLTAGYGGADVIRDISLRVNRHEMVGVLGANGVGKSTLLRALSGTLAPRTGVVRFDGADISKLASWRRARTGLAHVPEDRHVFAAMTVNENLDVAGLVSDDRETRKLEVFDMFPRLAERSRQVASTLSGGEQQMLAIGRALMTSPRMLLVDEMSAGLAPVMTLQLVGALGRIREMGLGALLIEQSPNYLVGLVDRIYLMDAGRIIRHGTFDELGGVEALAEHYLGVHHTRRISRADLRTNGNPRT